MVGASGPFVPVMLRAVTIHPDQPLVFDFIMDSGNTGADPSGIRKETEKMAKYFLASLTIPEKDLWVNLSPYENNRVIADSFGRTEMGRDLLAQDYILKQVSASLVFPEKELGREFWARVYERVYRETGSSDLPAGTFNKVWVTPDRAVVYEKGHTAVVGEAHLKVMIESDYIAESMEHGAKSQKQNKINAKPEKNSVNSLHSSMLSAPSSMLVKQTLKSIIIPAIEKEVNEGKNFAPLRQVYQALILATWYKKALKDSLLGQVYADRNKLAGVDTVDSADAARIYDRYLEAYRKGVFNYIREETDAATQEIVPRKYFSGGFDAAQLGRRMEVRHMQGPLDAAQVGEAFQVSVALVTPASRDAAQALPAFSLRTDYFRQGEFKAHYGRFTKYQPYAAQFEQIMSAVQEDLATTPFEVLAREDGAEEDSLRPRQRERVRKIQALVREQGWPQQVAPFFFEALRNHARSVIAGQKRFIYPEFLEFMFYRIRTGARLSTGAYEAVLNALANRGRWITDAFLARLATEDWNALDAGDDTWTGVAVREMRKAMKGAYWGEAEAFLKASLKAYIESGPRMDRFRRYSGEEFGRFIRAFLRARGLNAVDYIPLLRFVNDNGEILSRIFLPALAAADWTAPQELPTRSLRDFIENVDRLVAGQGARLQADSRDLLRQALTQYVEEWDGGEAAARPDPALELKFEMAEFEARLKDRRIMAGGQDMAPLFRIMARQASRELGAIELMDILRYDWFGRNELSAEVRALVDKLMDIAQRNGQTDGNVLRPFREELKAYAKDKLKDVKTFIWPEFMEFLFYYLDAMGRTSDFHRIQEGVHVVAPRLRDTSIPHLLAEDWENFSTADPRREALLRDMRQAFQSRKLPDDVYLLMKDVLRAYARGGEKLAAYRHFNIAEFRSFFAGYLSRAGISPEGYTGLLEVLSSYQIRLEQYFLPAVVLALDHPEFVPSGVVTRETFVQSRRLRDGGAVFDWLQSQGFLEPDGGGAFFPRSLGMDRQVQIRRQFPRESRSIWGMLNMPLDGIQRFIRDLRRSVSPQVLEVFAGALREYAETPAVSDASQASAVDLGYWEKEEFRAFYYAQRAGEEDFLAAMDRVVHARGVDELLRRFPFQILAKFNIDNPKSVDRLPVLAGLVDTVRPLAGEYFPDFARLLQLYAQDKSRDQKAFFNDEFEGFAFYYLATRLGLAPEKVSWVVGYAHKNRTPMERMHLARVAYVAWNKLFSGNNEDQWTRSFVRFTLRDIPAAWKGDVPGAFQAVLRAYVDAGRGLGRRAYNEAEFRDFWGGYLQRHGLTAEKYDRLLIFLGRHNILRRIFLPGLVVADWDAPASVPMVRERQFLQDLEQWLAANRDLDAQDVRRVLKGALSEYVETPVPSDAAQPPVVSPEVLAEAMGRHFEPGGFLTFLEQRRAEGKMQGAFLPFMKKAVEEEGPALRELSLNEVLVYNWFDGISPVSPQTRQLVDRLAALAAREGSDEVAVREFRQELMEYAKTRLEDVKHFMWPEFQEFLFFYLHRVGRAQEYQRLREAVRHVNARLRDAFLPELLLTDWTGLPASGGNQLLKDLRYNVTEEAGLDIDLFYLLKDVLGAYYFAGRDLAAYKGFNRAEFSSFWSVYTAQRGVARSTAGAFLTEFLRQDRFFTRYFLQAVVQADWDRPDEAPHDKIRDSIILAKVTAQKYGIPYAVFADALKEYAGKPLSSVAAERPVPGQARGASSIKDFRASRTKSGPDSAQSREVGGIDFDPAALNLRVERAPGGGIEVRVDPKEMARIRSEGVTGFKPVIINIMPIATVSQVLK
jgi:hypothetical protein